MKFVLVLFIVFFSLVGCSKDSLVYKVLDRQLKEGKDTIDLKNKFPFEWDEFLISSVRTLIDKELGFEYPYLEESNDIRGMPNIGISIIFLKNHKIVHHEDSKYKYSGIDKVGGGFDFSFAVPNDIYKVKSDSSIYKLEKTNTNYGEVILLIPYNSNVELRR